MTPVTEDPRTPLTLEYAPEGLDDDPASQPLIVIEPSFAHPGRIFVGVHPFGKRLGCHLLPADAHRVMQHLGKLLMEDTPVEDAPINPEWQERIEAAAKRAARSKPKKSKAAFRFEAQIGRVVIVVGTQHE